MTEPTDEAQDPQETAQEMAPRAMRECDIDVGSWAYDKTPGGGGPAPPGLAGRAVVGRANVPLR